jgi:hypothetical protein
VALGERPRTVAFGWNDVIYILDEKSLLDVERFRRVNIKARSPAQLWPDASVLAADKNEAFLRSCTSTFAKVVFAKDRAAIPAAERTHTLGAW